jgi:hypothetical protein
MSIAVPGFERKVEENPFNYTDDEKAEKKLALKRMHELWPDVSMAYAEMVYDMCKTTPEDKLKEIMHRVETEPSRHFAANDPRSPLYAQRS